LVAAPRRSRDALLRDPTVLWVVIAGLAFLLVAQTSFLLAGGLGAGPEASPSASDPGPSQAELLCASDAGITPDQLRGVQAQAQAWLDAFVAERGLGPHSAAALAGYVEQAAASTSSARLLQAAGLRSAETTRLVLDKEAERSLLAALQLMPEADAHAFSQGLTQALEAAWSDLDSAPSGAI
jgi:hypothetical protein